MANFLENLRRRLFGKGRNDESGKPLHVLQEYSQKLFESTERLAKRHLELNEVRAKLKKHADKLRGVLNKYDDQARKHYQSGQMDLVESALKEKLQHKAELDRLSESIRELDNHISSLRSHKERLQGQLQLFKIKREAIELRYDASRTELETRELQRDMADAEIPDVENAVNEAESEIRQIQIQLEATREVESDAELELSDSLSPSSAGAEEIEEEIERLKRELRRNRNSENDN